ncbi:MAG: ELWxxDGT repeat protein, partial [Isosphaeraceae bacterium]
MKRQHSRCGGWNFSGTRGRLRTASMRRRRVADLGRGLGPEALELRTLLSGQTVQLIKDVNTTESYPRQMTPVGSNLFFVVEDATGKGTELVVDNVSGTTVLLDTGASSSSSSYSYSYGIYSLTTVGGTLYFQYSGSTGSPLWTSDGTVAGTKQVTLTGASGSPYVQGTASVGNDLVFWTDNHGTSGDDYQLWSTTPGSTSATMIKDLGASQPTSLGVVNNTLYLSEGGNLWSTDGTAAHTQKLLDSSSNPIPAPRTVFGYDGQAEYLAVGKTSSTIGVLGAGGETAAITGLPVAISNPTVSGSLFDFAAAASGSSSGLDTQLWASDGTQAHTAMIEDFGSISATSGPTTFNDANGTLVFEVEGSDGLAQLWNSGGTAASTKLIKDLGVTWTSAYRSSNYGYGYGGSGTLVPVGGLLYFKANDPVNGAGLWSETLSTGSTQFVTPFSAQSMVAWGNQLAFAGNDGSEPVTSQLWTTAGSSATTAKVASFPGGTTQSSVNQPGTAITIGTKLLIPLNDGIHGTALWATDGTTAGTQMLAQIAPAGFTSLNGEVYFLGMAGGSPGLWKSDGTAGGTAEVKALPAGSSSGYSLGQITVAGGKLYFTTGDGSKGEEVWVSDGTAQGTSIVQDFPALPATSHYSQYANLSDLTAFGGKLAFIAESGTSGTQVWISDGTAGGTVKLTDIADVSSGSSGSASQYPSDLTIAGGKLFFLAGNATDPTAAPGLWTSDGTPGGTSEMFAFPTIPAVPPSSTGSAPTLRNLTAVGSELYLSATYSDYNGATAVTDAQLWTSNGTAAGTFQVPVSNGSAFTNLSGILALAGRVLFKGVDTSGATELWTSNGTAAGTSELKVIAPTSTYGSSGYGYTSASVVDNGIIYFPANDGTHGNELWQSNGTTAGTFMTADINPGASSSNPTPLAILGGQLVLSANDGTHGTELMTLAATAQDSAPTFVTIPNQDVTVGESISLDMALYASDPNAPPLPLTYSLGADSPSFASIDATTGVLSLSPPPGTTAQSYSLTITATDDGATPQSTSTTVTVGVHAVASPTIDPISSQFITQGYTFQLDVAHYAHDDNYPAFPLTYSLTSAPTGATIDPSTGLITWATAANQPTTSYSFTVQAADNSSPPLTASQTFTVSVQKLQPPSFRAVPDQSVNIGSTFSLSLAGYAYDPNSPTLPLTYSVTSTPPAGLSLDATTGQLSWSPGASQTTGPVSITVQVSDNTSPPLTASQTFTIDVLAQGA